MTLSYPRPAHSETTERHPKRLLTNLGPRRALDQPEARDDRRAADDQADREPLAEQDDRRQHAEDRHEHRERGRPGGTDPAHALVEQDEREDGPEDREVEHRQPAVGSGILEVVPPLLG